MAEEVERKFLVTGPGWHERVERSASLRQGFLAQTDAAVIRIRIVDDAEALLTIKSAKSELMRGEFEYPVPLADAEQLLELCPGAVIEKRRHLVAVGDLMFEIDVFTGAHEGLVLAEIELPDAKASFERPDWLGDEVTGDPRYYNANLAAGPGAAKTRSMS
jgi:adenylate cyclase